MARWIKENGELKALGAPIEPEAVLDDRYSQLAHDHQSSQVSFSDSGLVIITGVSDVQAALAATDVALDERPTTQEVEDVLVVGRWELLDSKTTDDWTDLFVPSANVGKYHEYLLRLTNPRGTAYPTWVGMRLNGQGAASTNMRWKTEEVSSGAWVASANEDGDDDGAGVIGITGSVANTVIECRMHPAWDKPGNAGIVWLSDTFRSAAPPRRNFAHGRWLTSEALTQVRLGRVSLPNPGTVLAFESNVRYELFGLRGE